MRRWVLRIGVGLAMYTAIMAAVALVLRRVVHSAGDEEGDELGLIAAANGISLRSRAAAFTGGFARAIMGGIDLDLRDATLAPTGGRLSLLAVMGGVRVIVPEDWRLAVEPAHVLMGGADVPRTDDGEDDNRSVLTLSALAIMGGVQVIRRASGAEDQPSGGITTRV